MYLQGEPQKPIGNEEIIFILLGIGIAALIAFFWNLWKKYMEKEQKEHVFFIDITTWKPRYLGQFDGFRDIAIPVENGRVKEFWCIRTLTSKGPMYIVPSFGDVGDLVLWDKTYLNSYIFVIGTLIGTGKEGKEVHKQWMKDAFPDEIYDFGDSIEIPHNFVLCKPLWNAEMRKSLFIDDMLSVQGVYTLLHHQISVYNQRMKVVQSEMSSIMVKYMQASTDHILTQWSKLYDAWNAIHLERTVSISVLSSLLHISPSKVMYSGLSHALNQGSIEAAIPMIQSIKGVLEDLSKTMGMEMIDTSKLALLESKINQQMESAASLAQDNLEKEKEIQYLRNQIMQMQANSAMNQSAEMRI